MTPLLEIRNLNTVFHTEEGTVQAVNGVSLTINKSEVLGVVGESGCGKSITSLSVLGLVPPPGRIASGEIIFDGQDLTRLSERDLQKIGLVLGLVKNLTPDQRGLLCLGRRPASAGRPSALRKNRCAFCCEIFD
jgi:ABC-type glutathione transport system ATPase component